MIGAVVHAVTVLILAPLAVVTVGAFVLAFVSEFRREW